MSDINYDKFRDSLKRLEERYQFYLEKENNPDIEEAMVESIKESCIQRFEICIDTGWKHLKKYLQEDQGIVDIATSPKAVFRQAFASRIIDDATLWFDFNAKRGDTSHDYDGTKADVAFAIIPDFIEEAIALYEKMSGATWQKT